MARAEPGIRAKLNRQFQHLTRCIWPDCTERDTWILMRVGPLCGFHARQVHDAMAEIMVDGTAESFDRLARTRDRSRRWNAEQDRLDAARGTHPGWVYYLAIGQHVKIGYSTDVRRRMADYPPGSELLAVEPGPPELERQRHREFAGSLLDGREWFRQDTALQEHVDHLVQVHGDPRRFRHRYRSNRGRMRGVDRS